MSIQIPYIFLKMSIIRKYNWFRESDAAEPVGNDDDGKDDDDDDDGPNEPPDGHDCGEFYYDDSQDNHTQDDDASMEEELKEAGRNIWYPWKNKVHALIHWLYRGNKYHKIVSLIKIYIWYYRRMVSWCN